jgi:type IV fimbrial biogenesis protein FimT
MVVVAVIGILAAVAGPAFSHMIAVSRAKTTATKFYLALVQARSAAAKFNANVTITPVNAGDWSKGWNIGYTDSSSVNHVIGTESALQPTSSDPVLAITSAPASVVFQSSGRATGTVTFRIAASAGKYTERRCVTVDTTGHPNVKQPPC